jgi:hypothetical protein
MSLDNLISRVEDILDEDKKQGRLVQNFSGFWDVLGRAASRSDSTQRRIRGHNGKYAVALPDGSIKADSNNPEGDWEQFEFFPADEGRVVIRTCHKRYLIAYPDGSLRADSGNSNGEWEQFEVIPSRDQTFTIRSHHEQYFISLPDGYLKACSDNPDNDWEQFELVDVNRGQIKDRDALFAYFDDLSARNGHFCRLTYVINSWTLGGVVRMKHHACILSEDGERPRHLKFDFGRWGIGWTLTELFPEDPKNMISKDVFELGDGDPQVVKNYCSEVQTFSWTRNNCSTFVHGLAEKFKLRESQSVLDPWPQWSHCVAFPPLKTPGQNPAVTVQEPGSPSSSASPTASASVSPTRTRITT